MSVAKVCSGFALILGIAATTAVADPVTANGAPRYWNWTARVSSLRQIINDARQAPSISTASAPAAADAYINFGGGPYAEASSLTTGSGQPWYTSPAVEKFFGGQEPNAAQQDAFESSVLQNVQSTFLQSGGLNPSITTDPSVRANHTMSVVSNTSYGPNPNAIGITNVGGDGFSFIDKLDGARTLSDLEWALAHNISHELMHSFGVAAHDDQTGQFLDAATATWPVLTDPHTTFSQKAIDDMKSSNFDRNSLASFSTGQQEIDGDLEIAAVPVPEPSTCLLWAGVLAGVAMARHRLNKRDAA